MNKKITNESAKPIVIRRINEKAVNIRNAPSMDGAVIGLIEAGDYSLFHAAKDGEWYKIEMGYVLGSLFIELESNQADIDNAKNEEVKE